jgi:hypothetical protein
MSFFDKIARWFGWVPDAPPEPPAEGPRPRKRKRVARPAEPAEPEQLEASESEAPDSDPSEDHPDADEAHAERRPPATAAEDARVEAGARARLDRGDFDGALKWLDDEGGVLLAGHETPSLPCLCVRCLRPDVSGPHGGFPPRPSLPSK